MALETKNDWTTLKNSDGSVGGRSIDVLQIAFTFYSIIRESFPVNAVPDSVMVAYNDAEEALREAELTILRLCEAMEEHLE